MATEQMMRRECRAKKIMVVTRAEDSSDRDSQPDAVGHAIARISGVDGAIQATVDACVGVE